MCAALMAPILNCVNAGFLTGKKKTPSQRDEVRCGKALANGWQCQSVRHAAAVEIDGRDIFVVLRKAVCETG